MLSVNKLGAIPKTLYEDVIMMGIEVCCALLGMMILCRDSSGPPLHDELSYSSVIGGCLHVLLHLTVHLMDALQFTMKIWRGIRAPLHTSTSHPVII